MELTLTHPIYLWYLIVVPVVVVLHFYFLRHGRRRSIRFANFEALRRVTGKRVTTRNITQLLVRIMIICLAVLALTQPVLWYEGASVGTDLVLAIDMSASMTAQDVEPNRLEMAKALASHLIEQLPPSTRIGLIGFSSATFIYALPTTDKMSVISSLDEIAAARAGGTDIAGAVVTAANMLLNANATKTMILISDGSETLGAFAEDTTSLAISYAREEHLRVHAIGIGNRSGPIGYLPLYYNISAVYNDRLLLDFTNITGGVFERIVDRSEFPRAERLLPSSYGTKREELAPLILLVMLVLLVMEWSLAHTRFIKIP